MVFSHERAEFKAKVDRGVENEKLCRLCVVPYTRHRSRYIINVMCITPYARAMETWTTGCAQLGLGVERIHLRLIRFRLMDFTMVKYKCIWGSAGDRLSIMPPLIIVHLSHGYCFYHFFYTPAR